MINMKVIKEKDCIIIENDESFNIVDILECGQVFSYKKTSDDAYFVISFDKYAKIIFDKTNTKIFTKDVEYFYNYFDLNTDYEKIKNNLKTNFGYFSKYLDAGKGIRLLKQDSYQTIISFIVSANNNIKRIKNILFKMSEKFGSKIENTDFYAFPTLQQLSKATVTDFNLLGAGYRSEYLIETIKLLQTEEFSIKNLKNLTTKELKKKLLMLKGVGPKVADCIALFGFSRMDVFPVDTWIRKAYYLFETKKMSDDKISDYFVNIYKDLSGYAQQYLYNYMLNVSKNNL